MTGCTLQKVNCISLIECHHKCDGDGEKTATDEAATAGILEKAACTAGTCNIGFSFNSELTTYKH